MQYLLDNVKQELFTERFRKCFSGFRDLAFEGIEERLSSSGGAGGYDPMFQLFERVVGIEYEGYLKTSQEIFQQGFPEQLRKLLKSCKSKFLIREYSDSTE